MVLSAGLLAAGALGSAGIGAFSANASSRKQFKYQSALQAQAAKLNYDYSQKTAVNSPTWNREGLESAGYNPMLAVQNSTGGANSNFTSAGTASAPDYNAGISSGIANAQSFQRLDNETKTAASQVKANEATAENQSSQALNNLEENKWISAKRKAEIANIQGNTMLQEAQIDNMKKRLELDRELGFAGLQTTQRGQALQYNASTYQPSKYLVRNIDSLSHYLGKRVDRWLNYKRK